jgi:hypothetical protein
MSNNQATFCWKPSVWMRFLLSMVLACMSMAQTHEAIAATQYAGDWVRVLEHCPFAPRDTSEGVVFKGKMWLSNGWLGDDKVPCRDLWNSSNGVTWNLISTNTPYDAYAEMVVFGGKIWAVKNDVWTSSDGVNWKQVLDKVPFGGRGYGELVVHNGKMWQLGSSNDVWHTSNGVDWNCVTPNAPYGPRVASAVASFKGKLWVMGGSIDITNTPPEKLYKNKTTYNDVWSSADGVSWECVVPHASWGPRMWFIPVVYADRLWIVGGFGNLHRENFDEVWWTDDGELWHRLETKTKFSPRHEATVYVFDNSLWVVAGNSWPLMNDVWKLSPPIKPKDRIFK